MKQYKDINVVMLPSNSSGYKNRIGLVNNRLMFTDLGAGQHLYFLSDEHIKERDWVYHSILKSVFQISLKEVTQEYIDEARNIKKIIATTDSLKLFIDGKGNQSSYELTKSGYVEFIPQPSQEFIKYFIEQYNQGNIITKVQIKLKYTINKTLGHFYQYREYFMEINPNNTINIKFPVEDGWDKIIEEYNKYSNNNSNILSPQLWLKENYNPPTLKT